MIDIEDYKGQKVVSSSKLYEIIGMKPHYYQQWLQLHVINNCVPEENKDYFHINPRRDGEKGRPKKLLLIHVRFAIDLCSIAKTFQAKKLRAFLVSHQYDSI